MINELRQKCARLSEEISQLRSRENVELEHKRLAEEEIGRLRSNQQQLRNLVQSYSDAVNYYRTLASRCFFGLEKVMPILEGVRKDISMDKARDVLRQGFLGEEVNCKS